MKRSIKRVLKLPIVSLVFLLSAAGCSQKTAQVTIPVVLPSAFSQSGAETRIDKWWLAFEDPILNHLVEQALSDNFSLKSSWEKLNQAKAVYEKSRASLIPELDGELGGSFNETGTDTNTTRSDKLILGLSAQYEIDLWGKIDSSIDATHMDLKATVADLDAAGMTIAATVAETWYRLVQQNSSIRLLEAQIATNEKALQVILAQFRTGQVPMADVLQQRQLVESKMGEILKLLSEQKQSEHQLAILTGTAPGTQSYTIPSELISLPPFPETGIPAELILARPDILSAFHDVEAADRRVAVAIADRFPALRLSLSFETSGNSTNDIFSNYVATVAASLAGPIIDGGQRLAEVERTKAVAMEKLNDYGQTILVAVGEVEDALIEEKQQLLYIKSVQVQLDLAAETLDQVKDRYLKGVENYQRVLSALTSLQSLQQSSLSARRDLLINRIQLYRALGRGWNYSQFAGS